MFIDLGFAADCRYHRAGSHSVSRSQVKAFNLRALVAVLRRDGLLGAVSEHVTPATRAVLDDLPGPNAWLDASVLNEVYAAVLARRGEDELRRVVRASMDQGVMVMLRPALEAVLRLFGVNPATVLSRIQFFAGPNSRGYEWTFASEGAQAGIVRLALPNESDVPFAAFVAAAGVLEMAFELCRTTGTVERPRVVADGRGNAATIRVTWQ